MDIFVLGAGCSGFHVAEFREQEFSFWSGAFFGNLVGNTAAKGC
jgi:hypothetical protein